MVQFRLLGPLEAQDGERRVELGRPKQRVLLAVLLVHANHVVSLDRLIEELWGAGPPPQAAASLQTYVSNLRRALEPGRPARAPSRMLVSQPPGYRLVVGAGDLDAARFAALAQEGHRLLEAGRPAAAAGVLREGLALWRGPALAEVADEGFAQAERNRLEELRVAALEDRLAADLDLGGHAAAVAELEELAGRCGSWRPASCARTPGWTGRRHQPSPARLRVRPADRPVRLALRWRPRSREASGLPPRSWSGGMISSLRWMGSWPAAGAGAAGWCWWPGSRGSARPGWPRRPRGAPPRRACRWPGAAATKETARRHSGRGPRWCASWPP